MSNHINIEPTEFTNARNGEISYGVRVYDDHACTYQNSWDSIPDDDLDVLQLTMESADDVTNDMLDFVKENESGLYIGSEWYNWCDIRHLFKQTDTEDSP